MTSKNITITSKNQITLPAEFVRKLKLEKNQQLRVTLRKNGLQLQVEPTLEETMASVWKEMGKYIKRPVSDDDLKQAIRDSYVIRWQQLEKEGRA